MQVVQDAAFHSRVFWQMRVSTERDTALGKLQELMSVAACTSLHRVTQSPPIATPAAPRAPSKAMLQGLALSFALADAGVTSKEYKQALCKLLCNEMQLLAAAPVSQLSVAAATCVMQALAFSGSTSESAKYARRVATSMAASSVPAALSALAQQHSLPVPVLTAWDWARYYVPRMELIHGLDAAFRAPAPLLHMHGLHVRAETERLMSQFSSPPPIQAIVHADEPAQRGRNNLPWRVYACWGPRNPADTLVLLLHSFLVAHLRQTGLIKAPAALAPAGCREKYQASFDAEEARLVHTPAAFKEKYQASFAAEDARLVHSVLSALHALEEKQAISTSFPGQLLLAECICRKVGLASAPPPAPSQRNIAAAWATLVLPKTCTSVFSKDGPENDAGRMLLGLQRVSPDQPSLRTRLLAGTHALHSVRNRLNAHASCKALRTKLTSELPEDAHDAQVCGWLANELRGWPAGERDTVLSVALLEDASNHCAWLSRLPHGVVALRSCFSNPEVDKSIHSSGVPESVAALVESLPQHSSNEQVAKGLQRLVLGAPALETFHVSKLVLNLVRLAGAVEAMHLLQSAPRQACSAVDQMRDVSALADMRGYIRPGEASSAVLLQQFEVRLRCTIMMTSVQHLKLGPILHSALADAGLDLDLRQRRMQWGEPANEKASRGSASQPSRLLQQLVELWMKAGSGESLAGCRVSAELARQNCEAISEPSKKGYLPERLQQECQRTLDKGHGSPSEMQARSPILCYLHCIQLLFYVIFMYICACVSMCVYRSACGART